MIKKMDQNLEATKEIVLKIIEANVISRPANEPYVEEVCKTIKKVYQTISEITKP